MGCGRTKTQTIVTSYPDIFQLNTQYLMIRKSSKKLTDDYQLGNRIGRGGFAEVRRCTHRLTGLMRAVKIYYKSQFPAEYVKGGGLEQEIKMFRVIDHPNIVKVYEFFEDEKCFYITMEFCLGGELFDYLGNKVLTEKLICQILRQLLSVVTYLHHLGIVHRDLKPENILIEERNSEFFIKIADFGNAVFLNPNEKIVGESGTSYYMAPEVIDSEYTEKCDEWSCGVILYMLLTGNPPFKGNNDAEILARVKKLKFRMNQEDFNIVSEEARDLIKKILVLENERITALEALNHPWFNLFPVNSEISPDKLLKVSNNLMVYKMETMLKEVAKIIVVNQILSLKDFKEVREVFEVVDFNHDGRLDEDDIQMFLRKHLDDSEAQIQSKEVMRMVDVEKKGYLEYSDFLKASLNEGLLMSRNNLIMTFNMLDSDSKGFLTAEKLMDSIGSEKNELATWKAVINEVAKKDKEIRLPQFLEILAPKPNI